MSLSVRYKWYLVLVLLLVDFAWLHSAGFGVNWGGFAPKLVAVAILTAIGWIYGRTGRSERLADLAHTSALIIAFFAVAAVFCYLMATLGAPLIDDVLAAADRAIGFDWLAAFETIRSYKAVKGFLLIAYATLSLQVVVCILVLGITGRADRSSEFLWATFLSLIVTIVISGLAPAASAWVHYDVTESVNAYHLADFMALRDGSLRELNLSAMQGLVTFPSFHTTFALLLTYAVRHNPVALMGFTFVNTALVISVPTEGGHYLVDVIGGAAVAVAAVWGARRLDAWIARRERALAARAPGVIDILPLPERVAP